MAGIFRFSLICSENTRDNGRNKEPKCFVQLPLVTGSQRHMAEKIKETENSALSLRMCGRCQIWTLDRCLSSQLISHSYLQPVIHHLPISHVTVTFFVFDLTEITVPFGFERNEITVPFVFVKSDITVPSYFDRTEYCTECTHVL